MDPVKEVKVFFSYFAILFHFSSCFLHMIFFLFASILNDINYYDFVYKKDE